METVLGNARVQIVDYTPAHHDAFRALNLAWITEYFVVEAADREALDEPDRHILAPGGFIFMALLGQDVVGTCALIKQPDGGFELAKMAVSPAAQGRGAGRALGVAAIAKARAVGAPRVELLSNRVLTPALGLYTSLGFVEAPLPPTPYRRANIKMVLELSPPV